MAEATIDSLILEISSSDGASKGLDALTASLNKLNKATENITDVTNKLPSANKNAAKSYADLYAQLRMVSSAFKTIGNKISAWIKLSSDYTETMNLFTVSMGRYAKDAYDYAQIVGDAMGIDPAEWMEHQGIFMTLTKGFGVVGDRANTMSQQLTQLGYDLSSFFNEDVEDAMTKLKSGIAGELEPLRRWGYDLSQAKLEATALSLGIDKAVSSMTQAEKAELRYYAIMTQVTDAHGDMARTLNAPANQMRILNAQVTQLGRTLGNFFIPLLNKVLPYAIASVKVLREVLDVFLDLLGIELADVDFGKGSITSTTEEITSNLEEGQKEAKKLKSYMLGFDELNVINTDDDSDLEELLGSGFDFPLPTYDFMEGIVATQVDEIVTKMKEWLGISGEVDSWLDLIDTNLANILITAGAIGVAFATWKTVVLVASAVKAIAAAVKVIQEVTNGITIVVGVLGKFFGWLGAFISLAKEFGIVPALGAAFPKIAAAISAIAPVAIPVIAIIGGLISTIIGLVDAIKDGIDWLSALEIALGLTAAGAAIGFLVGGPWGALIGAAIGLVVGMVTDAVFAIIDVFKNGLNVTNGIVLAIVGLFLLIISPATALGVAIGVAIHALVKYWDDIVKWAKKLPNTIKNWFKNLSKNIDKWFDNLWQPIKDYDWSKLGYDIGQWLGNAVKSAIIFVTETIPNWLSYVGESIKSACIQFFTVTLPKFFTETIPNVIKRIGQFFKDLPENIYNAFVSAKKWFNDIGGSIVDGIVEGLQTIGQAIKDFIGGFVQGFKDALGIHSPSTVFAGIGLDCIKGLFNGMLEWLGTIGTWCKTHIIDPFDKAMGGIASVAQNCKEDIVSVFSSVANWFNTNVIKPITNFFTEMWDKLVSGAKSTWEGIKSTFTSIGNWINTYVITPVAKFFTGLWSNFLNGAEDAWDGIKSVFTTIGNWTNTYVVTPVATFFSGMWTNLIEGARAAWNGIKSVFSTVATFFKDTFTNAWQGVVSVFSYTGNIFVNIKDGIVSAFKYVVNGLINGINNVIAIPFNAINTALTTIKNIKIAGITPFSGIKTISVPKIPTLADGGVVSTGGLFVAREAGPELVGSIGNRTTVMNNDQIVESVSAGVYQAVLAALGSNTDEGGETNIVINLDGEKIYENQQKIARGRGYNMGMGAFSFG